MKREAPPAQTRKKRLALTRQPGDLLWKAVEEAGWHPVSITLTQIESLPILVPPGPFQAAVLLSPAGAKRAPLPPQLPCLVTGEATGLELADHPVLWSDQPKAEGLWALLQRHFPQGGDFLLIRGEKSREYLEQVSAGTPWRLHPCITHREVPATPPPDLHGMDAVLALSPLQATLLAPLSVSLLRFAWGDSAAHAFAQAGVPATDTCPSHPVALVPMLKSYT